MSTESKKINLRKIILAIKRRNFIKGLSGSLVGSLLKINPVSAKNSYDVAIIGAGLAGLNAAILLE